MPVKATSNRDAIILAADVVSYSKFMEQDQNGTIECLNSHEDILKLLFLKYGGRLFNTGGDSYFVEFQDENSAVLCAIQFQTKIASNNKSRADAIQLDFRIGINSGPVVDKDENLLGDGVNIAARLEALAQPKGISISKSIYEKVKAKSDIEFNDLGLQKIKKNEFHAFDIILEPSQRRNLNKQRVMNQARKVGIFATAAIFLTIFGGSIAYYAFSKTDFDPAAEANFAFELPDEPSITVLPLDNEKGEMAYIGEAITENIISAISNTPNMFVISKNSSSSERLDGLSIAEVAEEFGVRYILDGTFDASSERFEVRTTLSDALAGKVIWSGSYEGPLNDVFKVQENITTEIFKNLQIKLVSKNPGALSYFNDHQQIRDFLEAQSLMIEHNREKSAQSEKLVKQIIAKNPEAGPAHVLLAGLQWQKAIWGWTEDKEATVKSGRQAAGKAYSIMQDGDSILQLANLDIFEGKYDSALNNAEQAVMLSPSNGFTNAMAGIISSRSGAYDKAINYFSNAMRLEPYYPLWFANELGLANLANGNYEEVIELLTPVSETQTEQKTDIWRANLHMSVASYFLGKQLDAFEKMQKAKSLNPDLLKYAELMQKLQRNKEFGQSYLEAVNAIFNSKH